MWPIQIEFHTDDPEAAARDGARCCVTVLFYGALGVAVGLLVYGAIAWLA